MDPWESGVTGILKAYSPSSDDCADPCERLVSFLEWASIHRDIVNISEQLSAVFEKGSLYRGFVSLDGLSLVEQVLYLFQKFNEYNERLVVIDQDLSFGRSSHAECLVALAEFLFKQLLLTKGQFPFENTVLVELPSVYLMAYVAENNIVIVLHREISGEVYTVTLNATSYEKFEGAFVACILPLLPPLPPITNAMVEEKSDSTDETTSDVDTQTLVLANIVWLVRVSSALPLAESDIVDQDLLDEQVLFLTQHLRTLRQKECQFRIESLRTELCTIHDALVVSVQGNQSAIIPGEEAVPGDKLSNAAAAVDVNVHVHVLVGKGVSMSRTAADQSVHSEKVEENFTNHIQEQEKEQEHEQEHQVDVLKKMEEREYEEGEQEKLAHDKVESLLLEHNDDHHMHDPSIPDPKASHLHKSVNETNEESDEEKEEKEVGKVPLHTSSDVEWLVPPVREVDQQFEHMMQTLGRYGDRITHTQSEVEGYAESEEQDEKKEENEGNEETEVKKQETRAENESEEQAIHDEESRHHNKDDPLASPYIEELSRNALHASFSSPHNAVSPSSGVAPSPDPVDDNSDSIAEVEISRTLFPTDDTDVDALMEQESLEPVKQASPQAAMSTIPQAHRDNTKENEEKEERGGIEENYALSELLPPPALSVVSPHNIPHTTHNITPITHTTNTTNNTITTTTMNSANSAKNNQTSPVEDKDSAVNRAKAEPLSSSIVANLMSSVGDESQSVDFTHYLHRAYELIKEHAVQEALEHDASDDSDNENDNEKETNNDSTAQDEVILHEPHLDNVYVADHQHDKVDMSLHNDMNYEESSFHRPLTSNNPHHYSVLESPLKLRDQLPHDSPVGPAPRLTTPLQQLHDTEDRDTIKIDALLTDPSAARLQSEKDVQPIHSNPVDESELMDLVPVPYSQRSASPLPPSSASPVPSTASPLPSSSSPLPSSVDLRPLTASMVDALPSSGSTRLDSTAEIEDYSAVAYQMFKNRALADLYNNDASCVFENEEGSVEEDEVVSEVVLADEKEGKEEQVEVENRSQDDKGLEEHAVTVKEADYKTGHVMKNASLAVKQRQEQEHVRSVDTKHLQEVVATVEADDKKSLFREEGRVHTHLTSGSAAELDKADLNIAPVKTVTADSVPIRQAEERTHSTSVPSLLPPVLTPVQVAALNAKLLALRTHVEQEVEYEKARKNAHRLEVGRRVLALLFAEKTEPTDIFIGNQAVCVDFRAPSMADHASEPAIRDVSVRSHGISFVAAPTAAPLAEKPVLSSHFRVPPRNSPSERNNTQYSNNNAHHYAHYLPGASPQSGKVHVHPPHSDNHERSHDNDRDREQGREQGSVGGGERGGEQGRASSAGASRLPRPAQPEPPVYVNPADVPDVPHGYASIWEHQQQHALPPPPRTASLVVSPNKLSSPNQGPAPAFAAAPAPPPRLKLNHLPIKQRTAAPVTAGNGGEGSENPTPRSARTEQSLPPTVNVNVNSARAQSAGRAGRKLSNYAQIKNAINSVCMAGSHFDTKRIEVFEILDYFRFAKPMSAACEAQFVNDISFLENAKGAVAHFMIMFFQSKTLSFKGIYAADPTTGAFMRVFGKGPKEFTDGSIPVQQFLKFETPSKSFKQIHVKNFSHNVDAFILDAVAFKARN